ncbi:MAG: 16S rRNA (cytidine(1402)-2'-O)-methyltransferase [Cyanobacteria bacterium QS_8_64_29]|nr:MAG: 16S rRNA (cytidine(1402)-2'-O)-methyltransferase [Cyanobacteria bacterium QS_8_64_29]
MPSAPSDDPAAGPLYLVATPIGNRDDITLRALKTLQSADVIAAEDTRRTGQLLQYFEIATPQLSYYQHNCRQRQPMLLARLQRGEAVALVSDAGLPGISDPGRELVRACCHAGIPVVPIPGATAVTAALVASGLPTERFAFEGFLPTKHQARQQRLQALKTETRTIVCYEAPHRLQRTLRDLAAALGCNRPIAVARELTKRHETWLRLTLGEAITHYAQGTPKGELTLVVAGTDEGDAMALSERELKAELQQLMRQGLTRSQASRQLAQATARSRRELYQLTLEDAEQPPQP